MDELKVGWTGTGQQIHVSPDRQIGASAHFDEVLRRAELGGDHVWVAALAFLVTPPLTDGAHLDSENLIGPPSIGCWRCEEPWGPGLARRRCRGRS